MCSIAMLLLFARIALSAGDSRLTAMPPIGGTAARPAKEGYPHHITPDGTRVYKLKKGGELRVPPCDPQWGRGKLYEGEDPPYFMPKGYGRAWTVLPGTPSRSPVKVYLKPADYGGVPMWSILHDGTNVHKHEDGSEQHILPDGRVFKVLPRTRPRRPVARRLRFAETFHATSIPAILAGATYRERTPNFASFVWGITAPEGHFV
eukprot:gnl/TRDRNA2_/TRDRNA2_170549_c2_seq1.p1 gnl/TRDRNA2_/TRDRNA2_170549_c2~~gnl/TRDRNA2_/TRDRNA2_170549_c2_seq1.p1  ORF type:complete len:205 (+),score=17.09 gnl/TRDRNA2_/TRDRNA2_170549_c2_seq1:58-672(+)